ncbi:MAG: YlbF family regulator [Clostridia bacterium]|nr:YlbF family regulator [Clostridia bacterium]
MTEVAEKARQLGAAIIESEEFKAFKAAEAAQEADAEALSLLEHYSSVRKELAEKVRQGADEETMASLRDTLEEEYRKVSENVLIAAYIEAQKNFQALIDSMNSILAFYMTGKDPHGGCSHDCQSCSGCH